MLSDTSITPQCTIASSTIVIHQSIPESQPTASASDTLTILTQAGARLLRKANKGHMPCGPI